MIKKTCMFSHSFFNRNSLFEFLLDTYECLHAINHLLHEFNLCESDSLLVGDIPLATWACRGVFSASTARLHSELLREVFELMRGECAGQEREQDH